MLEQSRVGDGLWGECDEIVRKILDGSTDAIAVHRHGELLYANAAGLKLLGYERPDEVLGRSVLEFVVPQDRESIAKRILRTEASGSVAPETEETFLDVDGHEVPVEVLAIPFTYEGRVATLVHIRDLRARRALENKLIAAGRLAQLGFVAAAVVHEVRSPLAAALNGMELLSERLDEMVPPDRRDEARELGANVLDALMHVSRAARDVGVFSGTVLDPSTAVDVRSVLDSVANLVGIELRGRARLVKHYGDVAPVAGTQARLGLVFANLLVNAAQAIPPGHERDNEIDIATYGRDGAVVVEIHDTGVGIPADKLEAIFQPFVTTKEGGTGLGLAIAQSFVEEAGGAIRVESEPGRGTTFFVELKPAS